MNHGLEYLKIGIDLEREARVCDAESAANNYTNGEQMFLKDFIS